MPVPSPSPDDLFPADPYPGTRPPWSFVHDVVAQVPDPPHTSQHVRGDRNLCGAALSHPVQADPAAPSGWRVGDRCLDEWLGERGAAPLAGRVPVLAYGSNANPSKISWMRAHRGLTGPVVVLRVRTEGLSAVWAAGRRVVDEQRPATLVAAPGVVEEHAVWLAAPEQFDALDAVEGRDADPPRYRLARVATGTLSTMDSGAVLDRPYAYVAAGPPPDGEPRGDRRPLLVDGAPVACSAAGQDAARALTGVPAAGDGLDAETVAGRPHPDAWPSRVFVYGSLMPGERAWWRTAEHAAPGTSPHPARLPGATVADTGHGYPALTLGSEHGGSGRSGEREGSQASGVPGHVVELAYPVAALPALDRYEGPEYRRIRVTLCDGVVAWAWMWIADRAGHVPLPDGWAAR
ncbi:gamma-glutamylcyclotransferase family protein [Pseudonocardia nematodicida]|uniref:Gamma-glutamylcyclotransferase family protein n=1 Tax=Pseudonocardia nematodicida TaxID=1206997 RepID=A0ABV1KJB0_9PSEU